MIKICEFSATLHLDLSNNKRNMKKRKLKRGLPFLQKANVFLIKLIKNLLR